MSRFLFIIPALLAILLLIHGVLVAGLVIKGLSLGALNSQWKKLEPDRIALEKFKQERGLFSGDLKQIEQLTKQRINWAEKLNKLSLNLPSGMWFNEITISLKDIVIRCSVVSLQKDEMTLINKFMDNLKQDKDFSEDFSRVELDSVNKRLIGGYDVADFILVGTIKLQ